MEKVKIGCVGVGGVASLHLKNIANSNKADLVAVCDIDEERAVRVGKQYGTRYYTDAEKMIDSEEIDALFICVPPFAHGDLEEIAAEKGIHLMVEKPVGLDMKSVLSKYERIKDSGIICATGYCLRYLDTVGIAKDYLRDKKVSMARGHYLTSFVSTSWYREMKKSGGQLVEQSTHIVDMIRYLAGDIKTVHANMNLLSSEGIANIDIPDVSSVNFSLESGAVGHIDSSFIQPDHRMGVELLGDNFRLSIDGTDLTIVEEDRTITYHSKVDFYEEQDNAFIEAVRTKDISLILSDYKNGLETLGVTLAANESYETKDVIHL
ncbi:Gfo/Idh/MocA family oxidoreductase [Peribacillus sp. FSL E2-0218]|uniref:Gfo/Idh/MocA family protein n=1 Tax=Peribacillus sp. FSL E2-0218 TaxID=2921364 RepID=UPI0030EF7045